MYSNCKKIFFCFILFILLASLVLLLVFLNFEIATKVCNFYTISFDFSCSIINIGFRNEIIYLMFFIESIILDNIMLKIINSCDIIPI